MGVRQAARLCIVATLVLAGGACRQEREAPRQTAAAPVPAAVAAPSSEAARGAALFGEHCTRCHAATGRGLMALGVDLTTSRFVAEARDRELVEFLRRGRPVGTDGNRTGRQMPGFNVVRELAAADYEALVAHLRELNRQG